MQVTVEICVEPKPRAHRSIVFGSIVFGEPRNSSAPENPPRAAFFDRSLYKWIPGESAPRFQLRSNAFFVTDNCDQVAGSAAAQHGDQLRQQARRERLSSNVEMDAS